MKIESYNLTFFFRFMSKFILCGINISSYFTNAKIIQATQKRVNKRERTNNNKDIRISSGFAYINKFKALLLNTEKPDNSLGIYFRIRKIK